ncbi:hypothetical protein D3C71_1261950 [compost metagenome]
MGVGVVSDQRQVIGRTADGRQLCPFRFHFTGLAIVEEARIGSDHVFLANVKYRRSKGGGVLFQQVFHPALHLFAGGRFDVFGGQRALRRYRRKAFGVADKR